MKPLKEVFAEKLTLSEEDSVSTQASKLSKGDVPKAAIFPQKPVKTLAMTKHPPGTRTCTVVSN